MHRLGEAFDKLKTYPAGEPPLRTSITRWTRLYRVDPIVIVLSSFGAEYET